MRYVYLLAMAGALAQISCEEHVVAIVGTDFPFSIYGALTPQADTQWVRVYPIEGQLQPAGRGALDAVVTTTAEERGTTQVWRDSVVLEPAGQFAHVFWAPFAAEHGVSYRLMARRSDGAFSSVDVRVPEEAMLAMPPRADLAPVLLRAFVAGNVPRLIRIEVTYRFRFRSPAGIEIGASTQAYDGKERRVDGGWVIDLMPAADLRRLQRELEQHVPVDASIGLKLTQLVLRLIVANAEWDPPGGAFDPEILVQPGTLNNVENGFGFVGAGYRLSATWVPFDTLIMGN